jgi:hypothetical protein
MLGFLSTKEDRVKEACKQLRYLFNPIKTKTMRVESYHPSSLKKTNHYFPEVRCNEINIDKQIAGFHVYVNPDGAIIMEDETTEYKFPPEMLGRVINGLTDKKIVK